MVRSEIAKFVENGNLAKSHKFLFQDDFDPPVPNRGGRHTQEEIAEPVGVARETIRDWEKDFTEICQRNNSVNWHDFDPPIYNVWKVQDKAIELKGDQ